MMLKQRLRRFCGNRDGVAAVEFAIVSIVLAGLVVAMLEGWQLATQQTAAQSAANAGAFYYLQGGTSDSAAQSFALAAWPDPPSNAQIDIARQCSCAGAAASCSSLCSNSTVPQIQITVTASSTFQDDLVRRSIYASEVARVR